MVHVDRTTYCRYCKYCTYVGFTIPDPPPDPSGDPVEAIGGVGFGTLRPGSNAMAGCRILVGSRDVRVLALGRMFITGNTLNHTLSIHRVFTQELVAQATWTPGGVAGWFTYVNLALPVTLLSGVEYYLSSQEQVGDQFYDNDTIMSPSGAVAVLSSAFNSGPGWFHGPPAPRSYGPVSFLHDPLN